ncbi:MAG TPA: LysR substrate-binding domain-containing protein, partial [Sphingomicrobium sp.]|nr:LysR substrate-binding domain-containing protein [Sphingomicrobium sp.]
DWGVETDGRPRPRGGLRLDNQANEGHAAMGGQGFTLLSPFLWVHDIYTGRLVMPFPDKISRRGWSYWLVYPTERRMVPKVKRFREWLLREMADAQAEARKLLGEFQAAAA